MPVLGGRHRCPVACCQEGVDSGEEVLGPGDTEGGALIHKILCVGGRPVFSIQVPPKQYHTCSKTTNAAWGEQRWQGGRSILRVEVGQVRSRVT